MDKKKKNKKKNKNFKNIQSLINKNIKLDKIKVNPFEVIKENKNKLGTNDYNNFDPADFDIPACKQILINLLTWIEKNKDIINDLNNPHNGYLSILGRYGVFGLALFLFFCWYGIKKCFIVFKNRDSSDWFLPIIFISFVTLSFIQLDKQT